jgi:hypothetical protein
MTDSVKPPAAPSQIVAAPATPIDTKPQRPDVVPERKWALMSHETQTRLSDINKRRGEAAAVGVATSIIRKAVENRTGNLREAMVESGDPRLIQLAADNDRSTNEMLTRQREDAKTAYDINSKEFDEAMSHAMIEAMERSQELDRRQAETDRAEARMDRAQMRQIAAGTFVTAVGALIVAIVALVK